MLTPEQWDEVGKQAKHIYSGLELEIIQEIAERIANIGYANTVVVNDALIAQEMGMLYQDIIDLVAKYNDTSASQIQEIFETAGVKSLNYDDNIYKEAGLKPIPIRQSKSMLQVLQATAIKTNANLNNLIMTTANTSQTSFYNSINKAYLEVSSGVKSYSVAILDAIEDVAKSGASVEYPSGYKTSIENACRMNIVTGVNQTCGKLQEMRADEVDWDLMELTAHPGARPEHAEWQGQIVSRSGKKGYLSFSDIGYGEVDGFKGVNCGHDWYPFYEGSSRTYTQEMLDQYKNQKVTYNGKEMSLYEANQIQRKLERQIRNDKKQLAGLEGVLKSNTDDMKLIENTKTAFARKTLYYNEHKSILDEFLNQTNNKKDNTRLIIGGYDKSTAKQISSVGKIVNKYNNSNIIGTVVNGVKITEIGEHIISRTYARGIIFEDIEDCLKNPLECGTIKTDSSGRRSFAVVGEKVTVYVNPDTGKIATTHPTSSNKAKKLKEKKK